MTIQKRWALQKAVVAHLQSELAGQAIASEDPDEMPGDIPVETNVVETDVTEENHQLFVRLDGFGVSQRVGGAGHIDQYSFMAHVFCVDTASDSDTIVDGAEEVARIQALVVAALDGWEPLEGASGIQHISSNDAPDENPATHHGMCRFKVMISGG